MATPNSVLNIARGEIGYSRWTDPKTGSKYGRWYAELTGDSYYGANGVPYCAMFVSWVFAQVDQSAPGLPGSYCPWIVSAGKRAGATVSTGSARAGDIVLFDWHADGISDHVGIVESNNGKYLTTIEGNTSNGNNSNGGLVQRRTRGYSTVICIIRPTYTGDDDVVTDQDKRDIAAQVWEYLWSGDANRDNMYNRVIELLRYGADTNEKLDDVIARLNTNIPATEVTDKLYRLRKDEAHTYTPDAAKAEELERDGWTRENPIAMPDQVWVYEATNPYNADCILTTDFDEIASLANQGWRSVGVVGVSTGSNPVYRLFNPFTGLHFYTDDSAERSGLIEAGWKDEGEAFRVA